jgi:HK97 gp10 family phage protein
MSMFTLASFAAHLGAINADLKLAGEGIIAEWCWNVRENARHAIGTYAYGWQPLSDSTIEHKGGRDEPLLDTGQLRDSIGIKLFPNRGVVGTNDETAEWHEYGTSKMPPRPFMLPAAFQATKEIEKSARKYVSAALRGQGMHATDLRSVLHKVRLILEIAREVKRIVKRLSK